jgi:anti-sigma factor RsiW
MIGPCKEVQEHLAAYVDRQIEDDARAMVQAHVEQCLACRQEVEAQVALKRQLQTLKRRETKAFPSPQIWANASREWDRRDDVRRRRYQLRFAIVATCMLLFLLGTVWARLVAVHDFPVDAVLRDFRHSRSGAVTPEFKTADTDKAARYLSRELGTEIPTLNLVLSRSELIGVDVIPTASYKCARLLYRTPHGLVGIYVAPGGNKFVDLKTTALEGQPFYIDRKKDIGLYGWSVGRVGFGVVATSPLEAVHGVVLDAARNTQEPGQ